MTRQVSVHTSARLHMGFFDLNGLEGRRFGSIGLAIQSPQTSMLLEADTQIKIEGTTSPRVEEIARLILQAQGIPTGIKVRLNKQIPEHSGLGSGTQLSLAIGMGISKLYDLDLSTQDIARMTNRCGRSGIGLGTFNQGGLIVDGGRSDVSIVPPVIARLPFPDEWPILLMFDQAQQGLHGAAEKSAFAALAPMSSSQTNEVCYQVLMQALPCLVEKDLTGFGHAISFIQATTGDYFAPIQGGRYLSKEVTHIIDWLAMKGLNCAGQTSWGPTGFAVLPSEEKANEILSELQLMYKNQAHLKFILTKANNEPSQICISG
jgi:beta-ribofuranosylaminobenzene 5'-phosphate synthase